MHAMARHDIDDTGPLGVRPHVRLCHLILKSALDEGFEIVSMDVPDPAMASARGEIQGTAKPFMAFPVAVYGALVAHFKWMADLDPAEPDVDGMIHVRLAGREADVAFEARRAGDGSDEVRFTFPARSAA